MYNYGTEKESSDGNHDVMVAFMFINDAFYDQSSHLKDQIKLLKTAFCKTQGWSLKMRVKNQWLMKYFYFRISS